MIRPRTLVILAILAVAVLAAVWRLGGSPDQPVAPAAAAAGPAFPGLAARLSDAARVEVVHQKDKLEIDAKGGTWGLADRGGYPVTADKLHELFAGLADLKLVEPRTADPASYARLGVGDPAGADATGNLVRVLDAKGAPIAELIVGHTRMRPQPDAPDTIYVRRPAEAQAWLAEGKLAVTSSAQEWLAREVIDIDHAKIASVVVSRDGPPLEFGREGDKLVLKAPAQHPPLDDYKVEDVGRALEALTLSDVKPADALKADRLGDAVFTTADGMVVTVTVLKAGEAIWARFAVAADGPAAKEEAKKQAAALQARLGPWAFDVGTWKEKALVPKLDDLKAAEPAPAAAAGAPPGGMPGMAPGAMPGMMPGGAMGMDPAAGAAPAPAQ